MRESRKLLEKMKTRTKNVTAEGKVVKDADWLEPGDVEPSPSA